MMRIRLVGVVVGLLCGVPHVQAQLNVAIMGSPNDTAWNTEVQGKLQATGFFSTVDVYDINLVTPSLTQMQAYCGVLAYSNGAGFENATAFGDNLADYVDGSGGVVAAVFTTASIPIGGRFNSDNYWAIQPTGQQQGTQEGLGTVFVPGHPVLAGVGSFNGGSSSFRPSSSNLHPLATRIADWTGAGGIPLIAERVVGGTPRIDLGYFPPSTDSRSDFWVATTDGALIMANALTYVCGSAPAISAPTLSPGALALSVLLLLSLGSVTLKHRRS